MASKKILVNLDLDSNKIQNLATPTADSDGATKKYVDDSVGLDYDGMTKEMTSKDTGVFKIVTWKDSNNKMRKKALFQVVQHLNLRLGRSLFMMLQRR